MMPATARMKYRGAPTAHGRAGMLLSHGRPPLARPDMQGARAQACRARGRGRAGRAPAVLVAVEDLQRQRLAPEGHNAAQRVAAQPAARLAVRRRLHRQQLRPACGASRHEHCMGVSCNEVPSRLPLTEHHTHRNCAQRNCHASMRKPMISHKTNQYHKGGFLWGVDSGGYLWGDR